MNESREPDRPGRFEGEDEHGFSPDVEKGSEEARRAGDRAFSPEAAGEPGPGRAPSREEETGVPSTDTSARSPLGVGTSPGRSAEEIAATEREPGREPAGVKGESRRPYGGSTMEDSTGVEPSGPVDEESPTLPAGDQAG
ncbi:hypothetical protein GCM10009530_07110 [Microbispora corallina]|uniref:Uncharacterized protein n=1 Tax=Microbispora corallina TaxID=83302 RepID=A0ABQ4FV29_9ACTN|nr:hypothetical protein [Microbispora corallina]GIH38674.1 hypothetical protein Mco01_16740 [Microbispora corallina]